MSLSMLFLAITLIFLAAANLSWFIVSATLIGVLELITAILLIVEGGPVLYRRYVVNQR